ncbi:MAG: hypothetical protein KC777_21960 [Cyanobacteria bacterium HKST-UBA02]|nr:hypothetical protein [Cyanobacteria bacterium HKST-UBA02]
MEQLAGGVVALFFAVFAIFFAMMMMVLFFEFMAMIFMMFGMFFMLIIELVLIPFTLLEFGVVLLVSVFTREDSPENRILCFLGTALLSGGIVFALIAYFITGVTLNSVYGGIVFGAAMGVLNACSIPSRQNGPSLRISRRLGLGDRKKDRF